MTREQKKQLMDDVTKRALEGDTTAANVVALRTIIGDKSMPHGFFRDNGYRRRTRDQAESGVLNAPTDPPVNNSELIATYPSGNGTYYLVSGTGVVQLYRTNGATLEGNENQTGTGALPSQFGATYDDMNAVLDRIGKIEDAIVQLAKSYDGGGSEPKCSERARNSDPDDDDKDVELYETTGDKATRDAAFHDAFIRRTKQVQSDLAKINQRNRANAAKGN